MIYYHLLNSKFYVIVAYSLKARIVESQQPAVTRQRPANNNKGMVSSAQSMPMAAHEAMEYVMSSLSNSCTATEERCFLCGPYRDVIRRASKRGRRKSQRAPKTITGRVFSSSHTTPGLSIAAVQRSNTQQSQEPQPPSVAQACPATVGGMSAPTYLPTHPPTYIPTYQPTHTPTKQPNYQPIFVLALIWS
jgi:hypothetical protein